jgi:uncharacterized protein YutE (UPF0331/DUF86 family)
MKLLANQVNKIYRRIILKEDKEASLCKKLEIMVLKKILSMCQISIEDLEKEKVSKYSKASKEYNEYIINCKEYSHAPYQLHQQTSFRNSNLKRDIGSLI